MAILVTGAAGFIGFHTATQLLARGETVVGLDNLNDYYDVNLKKARLALLTEQPNFRFAHIDLVDTLAMEKLFAAGDIETVIHLAAQAGVRYSIENPRAYVDSNVVGFLNVIEGCRHHGVAHLVYASTSSVYGANTDMPFSVRRGVNHPLSLYAATKKANELMAHTYAGLYGLRSTGLRFFTVYGPWGRPDMALFIFTKKILAGEPIDVFNQGHHQRDFTYVDDIVEGVIRVHDRPATPDADWNSDRPDPSTSSSPWRIYNIGNSNPEELLRYINVLEDCLGKKAQMNMLPLQPGDVPATSADVSELEADVGYRPRTTIEEGIARFVAWYRGYYNA